MKKIKLLDTDLLPYDYMTHHIQPNPLVWDRNENNPDVVVGIARNGISQLDSYPNCVRCAWVIEPEIINGDDYINVIKNQEKYDYIFLHDLSKKDLIDANKFVYIPHGGTHVRSEDIKIHEKNKLVSYIFSYKQWNNFHSFRHIIYPEIKDKVDSYGTGCNRGIQFKSEGLNDYCFSIAMENFDSPGLFTEKLLDCFLTGTIPIYYGTKNIGDYFNKDGFFQFETLEELNKILDNINFDTYNNMKSYIIENFERAKEYIFPEVIISNFLNNL
jgi:hypothetical protein